MVMVAFSVWGYCCTGSVPTARMPNTRIMMLTAMASTGRAMKRSVKRFIALLVRRRGVGAVRRRDDVVHHDRRTVAQLQLACRHHFSAGRNTGQHRDLVAPRLPGGN